MEALKNKTIMKATITKHLASWRTQRLLTMLICLLSFIFRSFNLLILGFIVILAAIIYQYATNGFLKGFLRGRFIIYYLVLSIVWFIVPFFRGPKGIHRAHAKYYEKRNNIENIVGVKLPRYKVVESEIKVGQSFDSEFTVGATLKFRKPLDDAFFQKLDSIILLPVPEKFDYDSSYFYYTLDGKQPCWIKEGDSYRYIRHTDFGKELLHSTDAFFYLTVTKGSDQASLTYGNY